MSLTIGDDDLEKIGDLEDDFDRYARDSLAKATDRRGLAMVAANITEDRYSAGSTAARATLIILASRGVQAAIDFVADLQHHEH